MTREEAIAILKGYETNPLVSGKAVEAFGMAIEALEQQPCEDVISKKAVDTLVDELARAISDERCCISRGRSIATIMQDILELPPVTPQRELCEDAISRRTVLDMLEDINAETEGVGFYYEHYVDYIKSLPPVKPQPCEDAISRKALISHIENQSREWGEDYDAQQILGDIEDMQPVNPQDCDTCEVGNPCLYCKHEFEEKPTGSESEEKE